MTLGKILIVEDDDAIAELVTLHLKTISYEVEHTKYVKQGIELYNRSTPVIGDVTSQIYLWDAGTEVNEMPGTGMNQ